METYNKNIKMINDAEKIETGAKKAHVAPIIIKSKVNRKKYDDSIYRDCSKFECVKRSDRNITKYLAFDTNTIFTIPPKKVKSKRKSADNINNTNQKNDKGNIKIIGINDSKYTFSWLNELPLLNSHLNLLCSNLQLFDRRYLLDFNKNVPIEKLKMYLNASDDMNNRIYLENTSSKSNLFQPTNTEIKYSFDTSDIKKNFLATLFPDIIGLQSRKWWSNIFNNNNSQEKEPNAFSVQILEYLSTKKYQNQFLSSPIDQNNYKEKVNELIYCAYIKKFELLKHYELFAIVLLYIKNHLKGIISKDLYLVLSVIFAKENERVGTFLGCLPFVLGDAKYKMIINLFKCFLGYAGEFDILLAFVFEKTSRYFVNSDVKKIENEPLVKLLKSLINQ